MVISKNLKSMICALFDVYEDEGGVQRVVTPMEYSGSNDSVVVRVRPTENGYSVDENGEAAHYAMMSGGDLDSEVVTRWLAELNDSSRIVYSDNETLSIQVFDDRLIAPSIFRVAEAAQQLHAIATARADRRQSDFKEVMKTVVMEAATELKVTYAMDVELPIAGGLKADYVLDTAVPMIVIAASSATRLLEAEIIYMQYRAEKKSGYVLAAAESQNAVGRKQYERASYYTDKTVVFDNRAFAKLILNAGLPIH